MTLKTELENHKQQILIIDKRTSPGLTHFKEELKKYDNEVYVSPHLPEDIKRFDIFYIINEAHYIDRFINLTHKKVIFIIINNAKRAQHIHDFIIRHNRTHVKVIKIDTAAHLAPDEIEQILWFSFSGTSETLLTIKSKHIKKQVVPVPEKPKQSIHDFKITPRKIGVMILAFLLTYHTLFIPPLLVASYFNYKAVTSLSQQNLNKTESYASIANNSLTLSKNLYSLARPLYLLLTVVIYPDNLMQLNEKTHNVLTITEELSRNGKDVSRLLLKVDKTSQEKEKISSFLSLAKNRIDDLIDNLSDIYQKFPTWTSQLAAKKQSLKENILLLTTLNKITPHLDSILAKDTEKKYLLLFANNMEIRPGGGFIGSYGIVTIKDYSLKELKVYDVYDADGQLTAHVDPPPAIQKYLHQPHWFLRDSAFSPDFFVNLKQAEYFLNKEVGLEDFSGGAIITTSAIQNILGAAGNLYVPDFKEIVNKDNFYIKAQLYAEKDFFPGSVQKKRFLSSVMNTLLINLDSISLPQLIKLAKNSFDEKQMAAYFEDTNVQATIDSLYWSGKTITPLCASSNTNCVTDFLLPVDANLGVNKANFFIHRTVNLDVRISQDGVINNTLTLKIKNDSPNDVFPGGTYKNYLQILIPNGSTIKTITKNDSLVEDFDEKDEQYKTIGFYVEIKPHTEAVIKTTYQLKNVIQKGQGTYQLITQKQIGSSNSDFALSILFPKNIYMVNQNFSALVKDNKVSYNTTLSADKIFFIDLLRE